MEQIFREISEQDDIWFCTNLELVRYLKAMENFDGINHSDVELWFEKDGGIIRIPPVK